MRLFFGSSMARLFIFHSVLLLLFTLPLPSIGDLAADKSALLSLRSAVGGRTLLWDVKLTTPCNWTGVVCDGGRVTALRLPGETLSGHIPEGVFGNLTQLRTLSLRLNALTGTLPLDLGSCSDLRRLYLQGNRFSGEIPEVLFSLSNLVRLNLAENEFTGEISSGFKNLTRLKTLYLENNKLSGSLLDLDLPLDQFNVSNNLLNGSIPKSLEKFDSDSFVGTSLCGKPLGVCSNEGTVPSQPISVGNIPGTLEGSKGEKEKKKLSGGAIAGIVIGCVVGFFLIVLILMVLFRKKGGNERTRAVDIGTVKQHEIEIPGEKAAVEAPESRSYGNEYNPAAMKAAEVNSSGMKKLVFFGNATKVFDLEDLLRASAEVLGKGTFGTAYKAVLDAVTLVAVKRLKDVTMADREFKEKIEVVGAMDHENLVPLRAYYYSGDEKLLVYDFMPMGSLSALLHGNKGAGRPPLNWQIRSRIALGAARGLDYLHSQDPLSSHGNVKSSNILLTSSHDARVSDFGLAQLVSTSSTTPNRATGYRAPEVTDPRRVSQKADVYSFGVVLLELLTGKAPSNSVMNDEGMDLARWVHSVAREEWRNEVFDSELMSIEMVEEEMAEMLQLGIDCTEQHPDKRPVMVEVVRRIQELRQSGSDQVG
ncbi:PREDICTED: probable inactive receptor kinase RLK902 isoform X2 [Camelina sativa]|uniref:Probable inactive receptor kinase RLK902 isoform X1 n=1 Tax=Camelina sativa TaxID=90675 RepID=A0ABM0XLF3_CAMSA|nr:PREDICTED: probable inactive receptor kinase RLK902 isoform X1 [Camelina sativa]XP_010487682.1 PREDICTED: probable inactive receptor kinase RLK902 isoform X2 [Camelina sativa]